MNGSSVAASMEERTAAVQTYDGLSFVSHMIAGAAAGSLEHIAMYPMDTIKTRMQALSHPGQNLHNMSVYGALKTAIRREGLAGLYKGVGAVAAGAGPAHAVHFAVYEHAKQLFGGNEEGLHPLRTGAAGAMATITNDALMTPADVVKQRLQVRHSPYNGVVDCVRKMLAHEGIGAFYKSYKTTLFMNIPFTAVHFSVYETAKKLLVGAGYGGSSAHTGSGSSDSSGSGSQGDSSCSSRSGSNGVTLSSRSSGTVPGEGSGRAFAAGVQHAVAASSLSQHKHQLQEHHHAQCTDHAPLQHSLGNDHVLLDGRAGTGQINGSSADICRLSDYGKPGSNDGLQRRGSVHDTSFSSASEVSSCSGTHVEVSHLSQPSTSIPSHTAYFTHSIMTSPPATSSSSPVLITQQTSLASTRAISSANTALSVLGPWDPLHWLAQLRPVVALADTPPAPRASSHSSHPSSFPASPATPRATAFAPTAALTASSPLTATAVYELEHGLRGADAPGEDEDGEETLLIQLVAGGLAGGCASAVTTPFDVVKTRLQTEGVASAARYENNVLGTMRRIALDEGFSALWRGLKPRVLFHVPSAAVCFGTYETMKTLLADWDRGSN